jgi:hypothetical protein
MVPAAQHAAEVVPATNSARAPKPYAAHSGRDVGSGSGFDARRRHEGNRTRLALAVAAIGLAGGCIGDYDRFWTEGAEFGRNVGLFECWDESFLRLQRCDGLTCRGNVLYFSSGCGATAEATPEFCDQVPRGAWDFVGFTRATCEERGDPSEACHKTFKNIASRCTQQAAS